MRSIFAAYCCALSCLSSGLRARTVSPVLYPTTASPPSAAYQNPYRNAAYRYAATPGRGSPLPSSYGYGHRSLPPSTRTIRDGQTLALYESPGTYEYMTNPGAKGGKYRVPETERRPPSGDDVEYIGPVPRAPHRAERDRWAEKKRKTKRADGRAEPETRPSERANDRVEREGDRVPDGKGRKKIVVGTENEERIDRDLNAAGKHEIHEKNEFSEKQQFFKERHVDDGQKKRNRGGGKSRAAEHQPPIRKRKRRARAKKAKKNQDKRAKPRSQGYGQILAVR